MLQEHTKDLALASPGLAVVGTGILGFPWSQISYMLAALYTFCLLVKMAWGAYKAWKAKRA